MMTSNTIDPRLFEIRRQLKEYAGHLGVELGISEDNLRLLQEEAENSDGSLDDVIVCFIHDAIYEIHMSAQTVLPVSDAMH